MSEHTTGPISIDEHDGKFFLTADRSATDIEGVGVVYKRADAVLFAAASELLKALEVAQACLSDLTDSVYQEAKDQIASALSKAND